MQTHPFARRRAAALAALTLCFGLAAPAAHAQGTKNDAPPLNGLTVENQQAYARAVMAAAKAPDPNQADDAYDNSRRYRKLTGEQKMSIKFTWTPAAVQHLTDKRQLLLWNVVENISTDLGRSLEGSQAANYVAPLRKIKTIALTTTPKVPTAAQMGSQHGFFYSFDKATGVLTMAMSTSDQVKAPISEDSENVTSNWVRANIK